MTTTQIQDQQKAMAKQIIRLTESDLHRIVKESVRKILREFDGSGVSSTVGLNNDNSADSSFDITANGVDLNPNDEVYKRKKGGSISMNNYGETDNQTYRK